MNLVGRIEFGGADFFLHMNDVQQSETFVLLSRYHRDDRLNAAFGKEKLHRVVGLAEGPIWMKASDVPDYAIEAVTRRKRTGKVIKFGHDELIETVIDAIGFARSFQYTNEQISIQEHEILDGKEHEIFGAASPKVEFNYEMVDKLYTYLRVATPDISFELSRVFYAISTRNLEMKAVQQQQQKKILISSIKRIDYYALSQTLDMSWYKDGSGMKKQYESIKSNEEFEEIIFAGFASRIEQCQKLGIQADVAVDTETTGLNIYNLAKDNPDKDHCVAIPICWEFGKSFVIFTDMEHFRNADNQYVMGRLALFFENFEGERTVTYWKRDANGKGVQQELTFKRSDVNLIGHNVIFDGKVIFDFKKEFYFNQDTLQMAFDINPQSVRGNKKLKVLTRYFFSAETPELEDVLGKGNEDKYRYLSDEEAAKIYGCADADFTLGIFHKLRKLMPDRMYYWYQKQDVPMFNILSQSEYWGMRTIDDKVKELAENTSANIEILKKTMYQYVGAFVDYSTKVDVISTKRQLGEIETDEAYQEAVSRVEVNPNAIYEFEFKPAQLKHVIYDIMKYPIISYTEGKNGKSGNVKLDKYVIKKLLQYKLRDGEDAPRKLQRDVLKADADFREYKMLREMGDKASNTKADKMVLIFAEEFNALKYPLALIIKKYAELNKEYTAYYKPMYEQDLEGKIFKGYNMARIETRRISNPGQTMKGSLKALIRSYTDEHYLLDFDMSQIEYRLMLSLSGFEESIRKMDDPESDFHTETASMIEGIPPYRISKKQRKGAKSVSFGVPYGLGDLSLCETIHGDTTKEHMIDTRLTLAKWKKVNYLIVELLEEARRQALTEWVISDEMRDFLGMWKKTDDGSFALDSDGNRIPIPVGRVENILGFYRYFSLENIDLTEDGVKRRAQGNYTAEESSIRRKAGNYPIQSTAAEIFRIILIRFNQACKKYGIADKVIWHMLIHDELLCSVKKDVHPFLLYKIVKEACMITMEGHTKYFVGINIGDTWAEVKSDEKEAPIHFVTRMVKRYENGEFEEGWFDHPWKFIKPYREQYVTDRIYEVIHSLQPNFPKEPLDLEELLIQFNNYTVRSYVYDYAENGEVLEKVDKGNPDSVAKYENARWIKCLETWALTKFGKPVQFISTEGETYTVTTAYKSVQMEDDFEDEFTDFDELFVKDGDSQNEEEDYWSFDDNSAEIIYNTESEDLSTGSGWAEEAELEFDVNKKDAKSVNEVTIVKHKYENLKVLNHQIVINATDLTVVKQLETFLANDVVGIGTRVLFKFPGVLQRWEKIRENTDLQLLDKVVGILNEGVTACSVADNIVFIRSRDAQKTNNLVETLKQFNGNDFKLYVVYKNRELSNPIFFSKRVSITKLKRIVESWR